MTKALTTVLNQDGKEILTMFGHNDGHPSAYGLKLVNFLNGFIITKFTFSDQEKAANGMECLAAQIVAYFKKGIGEFYLYSSEKRNLDEEFIYTVYQGIKADLYIRIEQISPFSKTQNKLLYKGLVSEYKL